MQQQLELLSLLKCIETLAEHSMRQFFQVVFSSTIIAKSGGVSLARDLAHTRPHRVMDKNPNSAFVDNVFFITRTAEPGGVARCDSTLKTAKKLSGLGEPFGAGRPPTRTTGNGGTSRSFCGS